MTTKQTIDQSIHSSTQGESVFADCRMPMAESNKPLTKIQQLVNELNEHQVTGIGARAGYFAVVPKLSFGLTTFSFDPNEDCNPRLLEDHLHLDLWFNPERTVDKGALDERIAHGQRLIKQTVVITDIDYINKDKTRQYW
ncbi:MAG: hypothetical protein R3267_07755 [Paenisporosarcina sp.]|nr:hypothetical protein [Paenisporosarcina sp.]